MDDPRTISPGSLSQQNWIAPADDLPEDSIDYLCERLNVSQALGRVLAARNLLDVGDAERFLHPAEHQLHPPQRMRGIREAVRRIHGAVVNYQKILIFGDYDVDGTAATTILFNYLKRLGARVQYYIPHRLEDGYGFNPATVAKFSKWGIELLITADHGSTAVEGARALEREGIDLIITDHHRLGRERPGCVALVNPQQEGCAYPFKELAAAGVAYKLVCALDDFLTEGDFWDQHGICRTGPNYYLDLVALATVADMSPLVGENRVLVKLGLDLLNSRLRPGLSGLVKESRIRGRITPHTIAFKLAPKINALGRIGDPRIGMQLLMSHSFTESRRLARQLIQTNRERQEIERNVYSNAVELMESMPEEPAMILVGENWHPGVIGSIATRIAYQIHRPTVVLTNQGEQELRGSARGSERQNVLRALEACQSLLERFGGHRTAAGLSLKWPNLGAFRKDFQTAAERECAGCPDGDPEGIFIETWIEPKALTTRFLEELSLLSPFGFGNPEPVVGVRGFTLREPSVFNSRHLRFNLSCGDGDRLEAYAWDHSDWNVRCSHQYDIAFVPQVFAGAKGLKHQIRVLDLKHSG